MLGFWWIGLRIFCARFADFCARFADFLRPVCGFFALGLRIFCARFADFLRPVCGFFALGLLDFLRSVCGFFALGFGRIFASGGFFALGFLRSVSADFLRSVCGFFALVIAYMHGYRYCMHGPPSLDLSCIIYKDPESVMHVMHILGLNIAACMAVNEFLHHSCMFWAGLQKTQPANRAQKIRKPGAKIRKRAQFFFLLDLLS